MPLQLTDRTVKYPIGILEDVPIRVEKLFIPIDFFILEMEEDTRILIILGRSFLASTEAIIDVTNEKLSLNVGDEKVEFNLLNATKYRPFGESCCRIGLRSQEGIFSFGLDDDLQRVLVQDE
ncbi:UNVERIFIED_CONTAM: hypothetical protein Slati_2761400 [Sesamum latifolium]|uniref:Reverse transcriptase domain-containing protein n=1 Tax=Sesamum latifolium TaxID=2727402 RepID=A0AAW2VZ87_9LAMI